jgi:hypothetical protein
MEMIKNEDKPLLESPIFLEDWLVASGVISPFFLGIFLGGIGIYCDIKARIVVIVYLSLIVITGFFLAKIMFVKYIFYDSFFIINRPYNTNSFITKHKEEIKYAELSEVIFYQFKNVRLPNRMLVKKKLNKKKIIINITDERIIKEVFGILNKKSVPVKLSTKRIG